MQILRLDADSDSGRGRVRQCHEIFLAVHPIDNPDVPPWTLRQFAGWLRLGWIAEPRETWVVPGDGDGLAGYYVLELPARDNTGMAFFGPMVPPGGRRRGVGAALLRHAAERARDEGRELLMGRARAGSPGEAFARWAGAKPGLPDVRRILDLAGQPAGRAAELRASAEAHAAGYSLVSWTGPTPDEYLDHVAELNGAFADSPNDPSWEPEVWDAERVRRADQRLAVQQLRAYTLTARHDASGKLAGLTQAEVSPEEPAWGYQGLTAVIAGHRGHRLGLLLKAAMLQWLAQAEPALEHIVTQNVEANEHMIVINDALGFRISGAPYRSWEMPVADLIGRS